MPPAPVFLQGFGEIGKIEVLLHPDAQSLRDTDGNVDPSGEIRVKLHRIEEHPHQYISSLIGAHVPHNGPHSRKNPIGHHHLLEISPEHSLQAKAQSLCLKPMLLIKRLGQITETADGPLNQLGEKRHEQGEPKRVLLRGNRPPVHVDQIPYRLKGIKRDPHGQRQRQE